jgi:hypothetical protein
VAQSKLGASSETEAQEQLVAPLAALVPYFAAEAGSGRSLVRCSCAAL